MKLSLSPSYFLFFGSRYSPQHFLSQAHKCHCSITNLNSDLHIYLQYKFILVYKQNLSSLLSTDLLQACVNKKHKTYKDKISLGTPLKEVFACQLVTALLTCVFVPTSRVMGKHWCGLIPARAVYSANFPTGMPIPYAPKSPSPRILSPSVTTMARTSDSGL